MKQKSFLFILTMLFAILNQQDLYSVYLNEIMPKNETVITDEDGDYPDWIEIYNPGQSPVNLKGYYLSDDIENLQKWQFPEASIAPDNYLIVFASDKDKTGEQYLHTNFKLSTDGEYVILSDSQGNIIDSVFYMISTADWSYARHPEFTDKWAETDKPTPGEENITLEPLEISHRGGFYTSPFDLTVNSISGDPVYYTTNGSIPTEESELYQSPIHIDYKYDAENKFCNIKTSPYDSTWYAKWQPPLVNIDKATILRVVSYNNGQPSSPVYTHTYFVDSTIYGKYSMPILSIVTDSLNLFDYETGIYVPGIHSNPESPLWNGNFFQPWERPVHLEYYETDGDLGFAQDAGVSIHGGNTRHCAQKSFKVYARNEYGDKYFDYPLFPHRPHQKYKRFVLRTSMGAWFDPTVFNDVLVHDLARAVDLESMDFRPVIVFINGEYWGIQTIRERIDKRYIEYTNDINQDSVDLLEAYNGIAVQGSNEDYLDLLEFIDNNDMADDQNFEYVCTKIDIENYINYMITEIYFTNHDWPRGNIKYWKPQHEGGKWRWLLYDLDSGVGFPEKDMFAVLTSTDSSITWPNPPGSTFLFRNMIKNQTFVGMFIDRFAYLLKNEYSKSNMQKSYNKIKAIYEKEMPGHIKRWRTIKDTEAWQDALERRIAKFIEDRPCVIEFDIMEFFQLTSFDFDCDSTYSAPGDSSNKIKFTLAPNPTPRSIYIKTEAPSSIECDISIYDATGKLISTEEGVTLFPSELHWLKISALPKGAYYLMIQGKSVKSTIGFIRI